VGGAHEAEHLISNVKNGSRKRANICMHVINSVYRGRSCVLDGVSGMVFCREKTTCVCWAIPTARVNLTWLFA
jgi:hypothetical protein